MSFFESHPFWIPLFELWEQTQNVNWDINILCEMQNKNN